MKAKKAISLFLALVMAMSCMSMSAWATGSTFDATADSPTISTPEDLASFAAAVNSGNTFMGKTVTLTGNIDLTGTDWTPIGTGYYHSSTYKTNNNGTAGYKPGSTPFAGTFDGNGNTISNLSVATSDSSDSANGWAAGLFGLVTGTVQNLTINNATVSSVTRFAGAVAGGVMSGGAINNCNVTGTAEISGRHFVGGVAGLTYGTISGCTVTATGTITASDVPPYKDGDDVGGIVGYNNSTATVTNNTVASTGTLTVQGIRQAGAVVGKQDSDGDNVSGNQSNAKVVYTVATEVQLKTAVAEAADGDTITLAANIALTESVAVAKQITLDLNGKTITTANGVRAFELTSGADMTVEDNGTTKGGITATGNDAFYLNNQGEADKTDASKVKLAIRSDVSVSSTTDCAVFYRGSVTLTTAGSLNSSGNYAAIQGNGSDTYATTVVTVTGGSVTGSNSIAIYFPNPGTLNISGGTLSGKESAVELRAGTLNVTGGTFACTDSTYSYAENGNGSTTVGAAIAIAQHTTDKPIAASITGATFNVQSGAKAISVQDPENVGLNNVTVTSSITENTAIPDGYAWSDNGDGTSSLVNGTHVAKIGGKSYATLADAIAAAQDGDIITLLSNAGLTAPVAISKNLTINLNGYDIETTDCRALWVKSGDVSITGTGTISANGTNLNPSSSVIRVGDIGETAANLTIGAGVTVSSKTCYGVTIFGSNVGTDSVGQSLDVYGKINVSGVAPAISGNGNSTNSKADITIESGAEVKSTASSETIAARQTVKDDRPVAIYFPQAGTLTINDTATVSGPTAIELKSGLANVAINGNPTIEATADVHHDANSNGPSTYGYSVVAVKNAGYKGNVAVNLSRGTFIGPVAIVDDTNDGTDPAITITGGTYSVDPTAYLASGYTATANAGTWTVAPSHYVAQIGETKYTTLDAAVEAAQDDQTIKLLDNVTYGEDHVVAVWEKDFDLDLNGKTFTTNSEVDIKLSNMGYKAAAICFGDYAAANPHRDISISNGTIRTAYGAGVYADGDVKVTLDNLTVTANTSAPQITKEYSAAIRLTTNANVIIDSGNYNGYYAIAVSNSGGNVTVNGGTFTGGIFFSNSTSTGAVKTITINGGTFNGSFVNADKGTLTITGGTFDHNPTEYLAVGYAAIANGDGTWTVGEEVSSNPINVTTDNVDGSITPVITTTQDDDNTVKTVVITPTAVTTTAAEPITTTIKQSDLAAAATAAATSSEKKAVKIITGLSATQSVGGAHAPQTKIVDDAGNTIFEAVARGGGLKFVDKINSYGSTYGKSGDPGVSKANALDYVDLRLQYEFKLPDGVDVEGATWYWTFKYKDNNNVERTAIVNGTNYLPVANKTNAYTSNVLVINVPLTHMNDDFKTTLTITYVLNGVTYTVQQSDSTPLARQIKALANSYTNEQLAGMSTGAQNYINALKQAIIDQTALNNDKNSWTPSN